MHKSKSDDRPGYRSEWKSLCIEQDMRLIEGQISSVCRPDPHAGEDGSYTVRSIYFDDYDNRCFFEKEDGSDSRGKFRIRIYNGDLNYITLECKQKKNGKTLKKGAPLTLKQCRSVLNGTFTFAEINSEGMGEEELALLRHFFLEYRMEWLRPKVIVEYERCAYVYNIGNVRITFDRNIRGTSRINEFENQRLNARPVMPTGQHMLEVKYDDVFPDYLRDLIQTGRLSATSFSKYYYCRKFCG